MQCTDTYVEKFIANWNSEKKIKVKTEKGGKSYVHVRQW